MLYLSTGASRALSAKRLGTSSPPIIMYAALAAHRATGSPRLRVASMMRAAQARTYADSNQPPLLSQLRHDLKTAMREKDQIRLSVLRNILAQTLNASKTASPIRTDSQLRALLQKTAKACVTASVEFAAAGRHDLAEQETQQGRILEQYAAAVPVLELDMVRSILQKIIKKSRIEQPDVRIGEVLKQAFAPDAIGDRPVDRAEVAALAKELLSSSP